MRITTSTTAPERATADVLAVAVGKPPSLTGAAAAVDRALGGTLGRLIESGEVRGAKGQVTVVHAAGGVGQAGRGRRPRRIARPCGGQAGGPRRGRGGRSRCTGQVGRVRARRRAARARRGDALRGRRRRALGLPVHPVPDFRRRRQARRGRLAVDPRRRPRPGAALGRPHRGDEPGPRPPEHPAQRHGPAAARRARPRDPAEHKAVAATVQRPRFMERKRWASSSPSPPRSAPPAHDHAAPQAGEGDNGVVLGLVGKGDLHSGGSR